MLSVIESCVVDEGKVDCLRVDSVEIIGMIVLIFCVLIGSVEVNNGLEEELWIICGSVLDFKLLECPVEDDEMIGC